MWAHVQVLVMCAHVQVFDMWARVQVINMWARVQVCDMWARVQVLVMCAHVHIVQVFDMWARVHVQMWFHAKYAWVPGVFLFLHCKKFKFENLNKHISDATDKQGKITKKINFRLL